MKFERLNTYLYNTLKHDKPFDFLLGFLKYFISLLTIIIVT